MTNDVGAAEIPFIPGYEKVIPFDAAFGDPAVRPDWSGYTVRAHLDGRDVEMLVPSAQITIETRTVFTEPGATSGATTTHDIPVITLTADDTKSLKGQGAKLFVDVAATGSEPSLVMTATLVEQSSPSTA
ncbi:MAG: hypothetical protein AAF556_10340 [Pseudomonadota bacterium]